MKLVHSNPGNHINYDQPMVHLLKEARQWEIDDPAKAVALYEKMIRIFPHKVLLYDRLMLVYRKNKELKKELKLLDQAIKFFHSLHLKAHSRKASKSITRLSNAIAKSTGLKDAKKHALSDLPQPLAKWSKRKTTLLKKIHQLT